MTENQPQAAAEPTDRAWQIIEAHCRSEASQAFAARRAEIGLPLIRKKPGERF